jgi:hypothetical protein
MYKEICGAFVALLTLNGTVEAQTVAAQATATQVAGSQATCALPAVADTVDLKAVPGSDLVTVPVEINGKPKQFLLVVNTNVSEVSRAAADELKLVEGIKRTETFQSGPASWPDDTSLRNPLAGSTIQSTFVDVKGVHAAEDGRPHVIIPTFTIGSATGRNLSFAVASDNDFPKSTPYDGRMTGSFFKQYDIELDFAAMKLNYLTTNPCQDPHQVVFWPHKEVAIIPMSIAADGKIEVQVDIAGHKINAELDTASPRTIMRRDIAENTLDLKANSPQMPPAGDLKDGNDMQIYTATFPQIAFAGGVTAFNVPALIQVSGKTHHMREETILGSRAQFKADPRIPALTLGMDVLRQLHLYVVYGQNNIYMTAAE